MFFYHSDWVQTVFIHESGPNCVMKAKVRASQHVTSDPHQAWVGVVRETGHSHHWCMAGLISMICSHVTAILFKIEACVRLKIATQSCTELPCV